MSVPKLSYKQIDQLADDALSAACLHIQKELGITDGGFASMWWSGNDHEPHVNTALVEYIKAELAFNAEEDE